MLSTLVSKQIKSQEGCFFGPRPEVISIHKRAVGIEQIFLLLPGDSNIRRPGVLAITEEAKKVLLVPFRVFSVKRYPL